MKTCGLILALLAGSATSAAAECSVAPWRFMFGQGTSANMTVSSGAPCSLTIAWTGGATSIQGVRISASPGNGSASAGSTRVTYRSKPGYRGPDSFAFAISGRNNAGPGIATVQVSVNVR